MKQFFGKKSRKALTIVFMASLGLHLIGILIFGTIKFVSEIMREETIFQAAPIESPPQMQPEYTVNLQQLNKSTPPPQPQAIVVNNPSELDIPALEIDLNIETSAVIGRPGGSFSGGIGELREMSMNVNFFGSSFSGDASRMLFAIDMSGSMIQGIRGIDGYRKVVDELVKTLEKIDNRGQFNIMAFSGDVEIFSTSFAPVSRSSIEEARTWLLERDPAKAIGNKDPNSSRSFPRRHQGTSSGLALEEAFKKRPGVIFFLSDGEPTDKNPQQIYQIVEELQELNKIPINTISYKMASTFMKTLAEKNNGKYTHVR